MATINNLPETITDAALLDFTGAVGSYSGKARRCCCGCCGNHSESKVAITRQINKIKRLVAAGHVAEVGTNNIAVEVMSGETDSHGEQQGRLYIVYFN